MTVPEDWAPDACTLPTSDRPLRVAEFDELFTFVVRADRRAPTLLELVLRRIVEAPARDLARRENECCSFFTFQFEPLGDDVVMHIGVPPEQVGVLDALEARAARQ
ncbi:hypothetical protein A5724_03665 [Mycobacterium sp. ACS1612]|uniref:hypothetical protein n=1 Tax=Mycobacterium sp. ACS1612 TaxID=1834117 RepID=UPI0007FC3A8A|nr:hypothetical protein [Mycobacterium sp. ACS1612]OBF27150.1 hypothetical protein A5724_03665 [Mycobacterium sp. ACS1612]